MSESRWRPLSSMLRRQLRLLFREGAVDLLLEGLGHAEDGVQGRAQLVAHAGEELVLEPAGAGQGHVGRAQVGGALLDEPGQRLRLPP